MIRTLASTAILGLLAPAALAAPANFTAGQWRTDMTLVIGTLSNSETMEDCMNSYEANKDLKVLADEFAGGMECTAKDVSETATSVTFNYDCEPGTTFTDGSATLTRVSSTQFTINGEFTIALEDGQMMEGGISSTSNHIGAYK